MTSRPPATAACEVTLEHGEDILCLSHPGLAHPAIHEASHAVAAVQRGIEFTDVRVVAPGARAWLNGVLFLGRVVPRHEPKVWVNADPLAAFEYVLAGYVAEEVLLGHNLEGSGNADLGAWRLGAGFVGAGQTAEMEQFLGQTLDNTLESVHQWVQSSAATIQRVAACLQDPESVALTSDSAEWRLSAATIGAVMAGHDTPPTQQQDTTSPVRCQIRSLASVGASIGESPHSRVA